MTRAILLVARWIGLAHDRWRARVARRRPLWAELDARREREGELVGALGILAARFGRLDPQRRPHYLPNERMAILGHAERHGLSIRRLAERFLVTEQTIVNWRNDVAEAEGRLVRADPPVRGLPDLVRHIAHTIRRDWPRWGTRRIAGILARLGMKGSRTSVQRILRRRPPPRRPPARRKGLPIPRAKGPGSVLVVDFTVLKGFFQSVVVGAVMDSFSRKILALEVWRKEPDAAAACVLLRRALRDHRLRPKWVVTDRGKQFTAGRFRRLVLRLGPRRRFARPGESNLSRLDRCWRSMKEKFGRSLFLWRPLGSIRQELLRYAFWHARERPHEGLHLRAPDEVFYRRRLKAPRRVESGVLVVTRLGGDRRLPVFRLEAA